MKMKHSQVEISSLRRAETSAAHHAPVRFEEILVGWGQMRNLLGVTAFGLPFYQDSNNVAFLTRGIPPFLVGLDRIPMGAYT